MCVEAKGQCYMSSIALHITFESRSLPEHEVQWLARLAGQWACLPVRSFHCVPAFLQRLHLASSSFAWVLGSKPGAFILSQQTLYQLSHAPSPGSLPGRICIQGNIRWTNQWRHEAQWTDGGLVEAFSPVAILSHAISFLLQCLGFIRDMESSDLIPLVHILSRYHKRSTGG